MKVVLFCGGLGMRLRDYAEHIPKPMVPIGPRPILWHVMKYYAYHGHRDFILCLGHGAESVKQYFRNYDETISNDFVLANGEVELASSDIDQWRITFVDTGVPATVGERLMAVKDLLGDDELFLANYSDGLTDLHLPDYIDSAKASGRIATFLAVHSTQSFHVASLDDDGGVTSIAPLSTSGMWINGGFFVLRREIFDYMERGEDLVAEPFDRLIENGQLGGYKYRGFWMAMDTFKDRTALETRYTEGDAPWLVWEADDARGLRH
jgi:glucose-1-phosphate cytidylyltransferase